MADYSKKLQEIKNHVRSYPDFPKPGIVFRDIFSILREPKVFSMLHEVLRDHVAQIEPPVDCIAALDARGFLFGTMLALDLKVPFVPIRKKGKLPGKTAAVTYSLEYGTDTLEIQTESVEKGARVVLVDDLLATGGSLSAASKLIRQLEAEVIECLVVIELVDLRGRDKIDTPVHSLLEY